jgi:MFS family permease
MSSLIPDESALDALRRLRLHRWTDRAVVAIAITALAAGFGQFGVVAALGDVSTQLGHVAPGGSIADKVGLSGTSLGVGLAIIRLASLASLPLIGIADRLGRRRVILTVTITGLALTVAAAGSPGYWWFVAIFAFGRPLLSATNALAEVMAAEETGSSDRAAAIALVAAGYAAGAGLAAIVHSLASGPLGFRGIFALAVIPLAVVFAVRGWVEEPSRFMVAEAEADHPTPVLGAVGPRFRRRLVVLMLVTFAVSIITGPANSFIFLYAQDVVHQPGWVTALMVAAAGVVGLPGLLAGRWLADHVGRRPTCSAAMLTIALGGTLAYSGSRPALLVGYVLGVCGGSLLAPAAGALLSELFPTSVRASATGWCVTAGVLGAVGGLVAFGAVADVGNRFASAAYLVFLPTAAAAVLFWFVPETMGREPEALWPTES